MATEGSNRVGDYEVLALLGTGGMGRVFKVRNVITNREEAMKVLLPDFLSQPELADRFMAEIRTLATLDHPNIAQVRTAFQVENQLVMVMEYVEGNTLDKLAAESRIPIEQVVEYAMQALSALSYAHGKGVIHRDIKPANIMITTHGLAKLMDFGIAKSTIDMQLTRPGTTMGSMYYMSPEQVRGDGVDARSDIYSFGVTLYEMVTGKKPFDSETSFSVLNAHVNEAPTPPVQMNPELPKALNDIVLCAMAKNPADRFQSAEEFRNALKALREPQREQVPQAAPPPVRIPAPVPVSMNEAEPAPQATQAGWQPVSPPGQRVQPPVAHQIPPPAPSYAPPPAAHGHVPIAAAPPPARPNPGKSHRGLWIMAGALTAILALVAVIALLPRVFAAFSTQKPAATASSAQTAAPLPEAKGTEQNTPTTDTPQPTSTGGTAATEGTTTTPATTSEAATKPAVTPKAGAAPRAVYNPQRQGTAPGSPPPVATSYGSAPSTPAVPAGPSAQEIHEAHDRLMNLEAQAEAASSSVQQIRNQQQAQGLNLRGDIVASMSRMNNYLGAAKRSLGQNDLTTANDYMEKADKEISTLEKFLGR